MEYNQELLRVCDNNPQIYVRLWGEYPQINPKTKIVRADGYQIVIGRLLEPRPRFVKNTWYNKDGFRARAWRALGELTGKAHWYHKGQVLDYPREIPQAQTEVLELKRFGYRDTYGGYEWSIACAYHATTDTLYTRELY